MDTEHLLEQIRAVVREEISNFQTVGKCYSIRETCELLSISPSTFHRWKKDGSIKVLKKGNVVVTPAEEIQRLKMNFKTY
jgi:hypothetical protein